MILLAVKRLVSHVVLVTGDSDSVPLVQALKAEGVIVRLAYGPDCHDDLKKAVDDRLELTPDVIREMEIKREERDRSER